MPLIIGDKTIKDIYVGDTKIAKAYVGDELVYMAGDGEYVEKVPLPDGYRQVKYIQSESSYFDLGISPYKLKEITVDIEPLTFSADKFILYSHQYLSSTGDNYRFGLYVIKDGGLAFYGTGDNNKVVIGKYTFYEKRRRIIKVDKTSGTRVKVDNEPFVSCPVGSGNVVNTMPNIFLLSNGLANGSVRANLRSCHTLSDTIEQNFIPCINPSGVVGLYDAINAKFYDPKGNAVTAGPKV